MHPPATRTTALDLIAAGLNDCAIARKLDVPRSTVKSWRSPSYRPRITRPLCPRCWRPTRPMWFSDSDYAELLGLYLGDGHIVKLGRSYLFRLFLDTSYPGIIEDARALVDRCFACNAVGVSRSAKGTTTIVGVYSIHLPCLFPQHGPGLKHKRQIRLEPWQWSTVETAPLNFLRGCIRSDGCYFVNRTGRYSYPSYCFTNFSADIRGLFTAACDIAGIRYTFAKNSVRIYRRQSVAVLERAVGAKE